MGIEQANNWRARRTNSIKLRTSDLLRHDVVITQGEGATDPAKVVEMQTKRDAARAAARRRDEALQSAKRKEAREARADVEHAMRDEQAPGGSRGKRRSVRADGQTPRRTGKPKRGQQSSARQAGQGESEEVRLAKALERLRDKYQ